MAFQEHKALLILGAALLFILGTGSGILLVRKSNPAPTSLPDLPISQLLADTHQLLDKGQLVEAERNYRFILERDPGNPEAITHLGNVVSQRGDLETALRYYDEALGRDPSYIHALWDKALALRAKGDDAGAIEVWKAFVALVPPDSQDAATVTKWIGESQAHLARQMNPMPPVKKFP